MKAIPWESSNNMEIAISTEIHIGVWEHRLITFASCVPPVIRFFYVFDGGQSYAKTILRKLSVSMYVFLMVQT